MIDADKEQWLQQNCTCTDYPLFTIAATMSDSINCNFARCAVRHFTSAHFTKTNVLPRGSMPQRARKYNEHFTNDKGLQAKYSLASKRFVVICRLFNNRWESQKSREAYLSAFSIDAWKALKPRGKGTTHSDKVQGMSRALPKTG